MCKVSIITINYNGLKDTCELLDSIPQTDDIEVVVVDNASANDEASAISELHPEAVVVRSDRNLGFAGGNNLGTRATHGKYLFYLNNDTILKGTNEDKLRAIDSLIHRLETSEDMAIVCPKLRFAWGSNPIQFAGFTPLSPITLRNKTIGLGEEDRGQHDAPHQTPYAHGAAMLVKREALEKVGLMPECYFLYYEELDWSEMFRRAGYSIWYDPCLSIYHKESQTTGQSSPLRTYYMTRNRLLFAKRNINAPKRYLTYSYLILIVNLRDIAKYIFKGQANLAKAALTGICDFLKGRQGYHSF